MNMNDNPTTEELTGMVARCDDNAGRHMLWVSNDGAVHLDEVPRPLTPVGFIREAGLDVRFRFETFAATNGYVGQTAANDQRWIAQLFGWLKTHWQNGDTGYIDY